VAYFILLAIHSKHRNIRLENRPYTEVSRNLSAYIPSGFNIWQH